MLFRYWKAYFISAIFIFIKVAAGHLDKPCNFGACINALLLPINNAFCDNDNRCRCKEGYVAVGLHRCAQIQSPGQPCEHDNVCKTRDENSFCDAYRRYPVCECKKSFIYDSVQKKCIPYVKNSKKSTPLFPMTATILIACIGIFCGCGIICHNCRNRPETSVEHIGPRRTSRSSNVSNTEPGTNRTNGNNSQNDASFSEPSHRPLVRSDSHSSSSKYDSLLYDDPPPKYEDAIKEYPEEIVIDSQQTNTIRPVIAQS